MDTLHLITVREFASREIQATGARVGVRIAGDSLFTGSEAMKKAVEVAKLVAALKECGIGEDQIQLVNVSIGVDSGVFSKSSSASYDLIIECRSLDLLGHVVAAISSRKSAQITAISWNYPELEKARRELIQEAVRAAKNGATTVAEALAIPLLGVHTLSYEVSGLLDTELHIPRTQERASGIREFKRGLADVFNTLDLSHTTTFTVIAKAEFLVGKFVEDGA